MESIIEFLQANPLYAAGIALLLVFLIIGLIKKAVVLIVVAVLLNVAYIYYLHDMAEDAYQKASRGVESATEMMKDVIDP